jgi:hypothetical protein
VRSSCSWAFNAAMTWSRSMEPILHNSQPQATAVPYARSQPFRPQRLACGRRPRPAAPRAADHSACKESAVSLRSRGRPQRVDTAIELRPEPQA